jgi:type I restriction enzyme R subunit
MTWKYSEDNLFEQTAIDLFLNQLGWDTLLAYNTKGFGNFSGLLMRNYTLKYGNKEVKNQ